MLDTNDVNSQTYRKLWKMEKCANSIHKRRINMGIDRSKRIFQIENNIFHIKICKFIFNWIFFGGFLFVRFYQFNSHTHISKYTIFIIVVRMFWGVFFATSSLFFFVTRTHLEAIYLVLESRDGSPYQNELDQKRAYILIHNNNNKNILSTIFRCDYFLYGKERNTGCHSIQKNKFIF